jgi:crotonobetainyl-CoA:carnitine CoA-transferase CaiB-like acyl-CoA transferase
LNGRGQHVEAAMVNGAISMMAYLASEYFVTGRLPERTGNDHPLVAPYGLFNTADGEIAVAPSNDVILRKFLAAIGLEHLLDNQRYDTNAKRFERRAELRELIEAALSVDTSDAWIARINAAGVPCGRVQNLAEVFSDPQVIAQQMAMDVEHPGHGSVRMLGFPVKLHGTPCEVRLPAPALGEHTEEVLASVGLGLKVDKYA